MHIDFMVELYREQLEDGHYFLHEHPRWATSWQLPSVEALMAVPGVGLTQGDQCQYGAESVSGKDMGCPIKKPTGFLSNSDAVLEALSRRCTGTGGACSRHNPSKRGTAAATSRHTACLGKNAKSAARYPRGLCRAMIKGVVEQLRRDKLLKDGCFGVQVPDDDDEVQKSMTGPAQGFSGMLGRSDEASPQRRACGRGSR